MKISSKAKYGLMSCVLLAQNFEKGNVCVSELADKIAVSEKYLEQVMALLKKKNIVSAQRGASGGYVLADNPQKITVGQIMRATEDNLEIVDCFSKNCCSSGDCMSFSVWKRLYHSMNNFLDSITLEQLVNEGKEIL